MWSRVRHRRLQALSLVALAALLTTSLCLGPLYQRAMEQGLAGSVLADATPPEKAVRLSADGITPDNLAGQLPSTLAPYFGKPLESAVVSASVEPPSGQRALATRLYAVAGACQHLRVVDGSCPARTGEVMVSTDDAELNGWAVGSTVRATERVNALFEGSVSPHGKVTIVGVYQPDPDDDWLGAPITGRAGHELQDVGLGTDDWLTVLDTVTGNEVANWDTVTGSVAWSIATVDHDDLLEVGPRVAAFQKEVSVSSMADHPIRVETNVPNLAAEVAKGSDQGRTTVVVLVVQLLVLIAVVLWMVLVAATDDRRNELALARLRGRGRRGAASYLLAELLPLTLCGVVIGVLAAPLVMAVVAKVVFPVPVPHALPDGFLLAALGAVLAVTAVVLAAARRAVREPVDSLLRAVPARTGSRAGAAEITAIVFSLTAVLALVTGNLEGPLATLAPTLLAVAVGLLLGKALAPVTLAISRRLLRSGRAVAAAGIVNAVRRPAARRVLVMVVVASALLVFCVDAMVTGQHNRQNAAEQANGAPYQMVLLPTHLQDVLAAVAQVDPDGRHLTPVISTPTLGARSAGSTVAVDPAAFQRVAYFPLSSPNAGRWDSIKAPEGEPLRLQGTTLAGTMDASLISLDGPSTRYSDAQAQLQYQDADDQLHNTSVALIPRKDGSVPVSAKLQCADGCIFTGIGISTPPGLQITGTLVFRDLTVDGTPFDLGDPEDYRRVVNDDGSAVPASDPAGNLGTQVVTEGSEPPVMVRTWVPEPVPALVSGDETKQFDGPGLQNNIHMTVAGHLPRVPGAGPNARVVDLEGLVRRGDTSVVNDGVAIWSDDAGALEKVKKALRDRGVLVGRVRTVGDARAQFDASPAAWSLALSVLVGGAALLVAMLVMIVATATTWRARATDLAALRMAGLTSRALRRLELLGQLPVVLVGGVAGSVCGTVAAALALPGVRQFTDPPAVETTDFATPWAAVLGAAVAGLVLLSLLAVVSSRWTARRAPLNRIREVV